MTRCEKCQGTRIDPTTGGECGCGPPKPASEGRAWTAGEWRIEGFSVGTDGRRGEYLISGGVNQYGDGPAAYVGQIKTEADANLTVAAPDMFEALAVCEQVLTTLAMTHMDTEARDAAEIVQAVRRKARGQ